MRLRKRVVLLALWLLPAAVRAQAARAGAMAPEIDLPALDGGRIRLSTLRGHPIVLSFWGTWCPPCRSEFPELVKAHRAHGPAGLHVIGINGRDQERTTEDVRSFVNEFRATFRIALDARGRARRAYELVGLPTTIFVDTAGVIRGVHRGPIDSLALARGIATIHPPR